jgi:hypothetical protein
VHPFDLLRDFLPAELLVGAAEAVDEIVDLALVRLHWECREGEMRI